MKRLDISKIIREKEKLTVFILAVLFVVQIVPILYLGRFNHPTSDDFYYGAASHEVWQETGSVLKTFGAAVRGVTEDYRTWQGSYAALFLMRLEPTVFGESCYAVVPWLMIGMLTLGTLYFLRTLCKIVLQSDSLHYISLSVVILSLCIQFSPVASEQFFWYNSSVYYNLFHGLLLLYLSWLIRFWVTEKRRYVVYMLLGGIALGGGNYVTALLLLIIQATSIGILGYYRKRKKLLVTAALWIEFLAAFFISAMAPGNVIRGSEIAGYSAVSSIFHSLIQGVRYYKVWLDKWWLVAALFMLPVMIGFVKNCSFSFSYPAIVLLYGYGVFSAMSCPTFYALGSTGPGRIINIIYDSFLLISYLQLFYLTGWLYRKWEKIASGDRALWEKTGALYRLFMNSAIAVLSVMLVIAGDILGMTTVTALKVWVKGEGRQYDAEYRQRLALLEDESIQDVVFMPYTVEPKLVFIADGTEDSEFVNNREWADFYGKRSLIVLPREEE